MHKYEYKGKFIRKIRITSEQLEWLRKNKDTRTMAGFLDKIINKYRKDGK